MNVAGAPPLFRPGRAVTSNRPPRVIVLGDTSVDVLLRMPQLPGPGGDAVATSQQQSLGGSVTNTAVALRQLGHQPLLISRIGNDSGGDFARRTLGNLGVDCAAMTVDPQEPTSLNIVAITPDGERSMMAYRGANARLTPEVLKADLFIDARWLHLSGYALLAEPQRSAARRAVALARLHQVPISLDVPVAGVTGAPEATLGLLPDLSMVMIGTDDALALTAQTEVTAAAQYLLARCQTVAIKDGPRGAWLYRRPGPPVHIPALAVTVRDTTGSGDAFAAGLIAATLAELPDAAQLLLANTVGAVVAAQDGASAPALPVITKALDQWPPTQADAVTAVRAVLAQG